MMESGGLFLIAAGLLLVSTGIAALKGKQPQPQAWQPGDRVSLVELGASALDSNFMPAGELRWEQQATRFVCWIGLVAGIALAAAGVWSSLNS